MSTLPWLILIYAIWFWTTNYIYWDKIWYGYCKRTTHTYQTDHFLYSWHGNILFCTSQNALSIAKQQQQQHTRTTDMGQGSLPYSNLELNKMKCSDDKSTLTLKTRGQPLIFEKYYNCLPLDKRKDCWGWELKISDLTLCKLNVIPWDCSACTVWHVG